MSYNSGDYDFVFANDAFKHGGPATYKKFYDFRLSLVLSCGRGDNSRNLRMEMRSKLRSLAHSCTHLSPVTYSKSPRYNFTMHT